MVSIYKGWPRLHIIKQVRMIADFLKLHEHVEQLYFVLGLAMTVDHVDVT
jgi:hypothetical protein